MASKPRPASKPGMASKGPYGQQTRYGQQDPVWPAKPGMTSKPGSPNLPSHNHLLDLFKSNYRDYFYLLHLLNYLALPPRSCPKVDYSLVSAPVLPLRPINTPHYILNSP